MQLFCMNAINPDHSRDYCCLVSGFASSWVGVESDPVEKQEEQIHSRIGQLSQQTARGDLQLDFF